MEKNILENLKFIKAISDILKIDIVQRSLYGFGLILWIFIVIDDLKYYNSESSLGIKYIWLFSIPTILLIGQVIFNRKIFWVIIFGLIVTYSIWTLWNFFFLQVMIDYHRDHIPKSNWPFTDIITFLLLFVILFLINWTIWKMKPKK